MLELKSSLGYHWFQLFCFCVQIFSHVKNVGLIRSVDSTIEEKWKEKPLYLSLIIVALTIVGSSLSSVCHCLREFGNSLEDEDWTIEQMIERRRSTLPYLTLFDIHLALFILLPSILLETQFIRGEIKDQSLVFESSVDFLIGDGLRRVEKEKENLSLLTLTRSSSSSRSDWNVCASSSLFNYFLVLLRFHFAFANRFYRFDLCLTFLLSIYSLLVVLLSVVLFSSFEVLFKEVFLLTLSFNIHSYFLIFSLFLSIVFILLTSHSFFHLVLLIYSQQQFQQTNQLIRLSELNDRYLMFEEIRRSLLFYLFLVFLSFLCQFPLLILILRLFQSGLVDRLLLLYLILLGLYSFLSLFFFVLMNLSPSMCFKHLISSSSPSEGILRSNSLVDVEDKCDPSTLIASRSVSSCGLTIIDNLHSIDIESLLVMH